ncbi:MAG: adenine phosphoribosyltransferase [Methylococcales bacterium]|nr:adenine phosphoribosyltransferase [Methylococcales bacterium]MCK5924312.1 adenine phosphoribosyltransferase [Methylococcales bacterium]
MTDLLKDNIRDIPDFPKSGIIFKDISPLLKNPQALKQSIQQLAQPFFNQNITAVVGMEARGFIFGSLVALELSVGFIPLRKAGKLPYNVKSISYNLEYGSACLEIHSDALTQNDLVLVIDDVLATGGTAKASCELIESLGAQIKACAFLIELDELNGKEKLSNYQTHSLLHY